MTQARLDRWLLDRGILPSAADAEEARRLYSAIELFGWES